MNLLLLMALAGLPDAPPVQHSDAWTQLWLDGKGPAMNAAPPQTQTVMQAFTELVPVTSCGRRGCQTTYQYRTVYRPVQQAVAAPPKAPEPPRIIALPAPVPMQTETTIKEKKHKTVIKTRTTSAAFEMVNGQRMRRGLRPFVWDEGLARAAEKCAKIKAQNCLSGHLNGPMSDYACIEDGTPCAATGADGSKIAANDPNWYTCCMDDNYTYAGAGCEIGADGCKYMSLFVR